MTVKHHSKPSEANDHARVRTSFTGLGGAIHAFVIPGIAFQLMPVIVGAVKDDLGLSIGQLGAIPATELGAMTLANLVGAWLIRGGTWRTLLCSGWILLILGNLASATASSAEALFACRAFAGFGGGLLSAVAAAALARAPSPERIFATSAVTQSILAAACMAAAPTLLKLGSWGALFTTIAVLALPGLAVIGRIAALHPLASGAREHVRIPRARWNALLVWGPVGMFLSYLAMSMVWVYLGEVGTQSSLSIEAVAAGLSAGTLAGVASSLFVTAVGSRLPRVTALSITLCLACVALTIIFNAHAGWLFALGVILWTFGATMFTPYAFAITAQADPSGASTSLASALTGAGAATGPLLAGPIVAGAGFAGIGWLGVGFLAAGFVVLASLALRTSPISADATRTSA